MAEDLNLVDEEYITRMTGFESDCNDGKGDPMACHQVGEFFSLVKDDRLRAGKVYEKNCTDKNYSASCFNLAKLYMTGKGVTQSDEKAENFFKQSCTGGHLYGCYHQGLLMYLADDEERQTQSSPAVKGPVTTGPKDMTKRQLEGLKIIESSCNGGEHDSCYLAGTHYINPAVKKRNPALAVKYLEKSCTGNHGPSCFNLAVIFNKGDVGVPANPELFLKYRDRTHELIEIHGGLKSHKFA